MKRNTLIFGLVLLVFLLGAGSFDECLGQLMVSGCGRAENSGGGSSGVGASVYNHLMSLYSLPNNCATPQSHPQPYIVGDKVMSWYYFGWCQKGEVFEWHWFSSKKNYLASYYTIPYDGYWCGRSWWDNGIPDDVGQWGVHLFRSGVYQDSDSFTVAFPFDSGAYYLEPVDQDPPGKRRSLILIHGNHAEENGSPFGWNEYISDPAFRKLFKMYLFRWNSGGSDQAAGKALGYLLDDNLDLVNSSPIILPHSRGAIVARYYMNDYVISGGNFSGKPGGERIKWLVPLAGPHRGTPGADPVWVTFSVDYNFSGNKPLAETISTLYYDVVYDSTLSNLTWDDGDNQMTDDYVCWNSSLMGDGYCAKLYQNYSLLDLNKREKYLKKMIVFGGNNFNREPLISIAADPSLYIPYCSLCDHRRLDLGAALMAVMPIIPNGYIPGMAIPAARPDEANDGAVSLRSALFLKPGSGNVFAVNKKGKLAYNKNNLKKYIQVKQAVIIIGQVDHLDFLDRKSVVKLVKDKLKTLR